jgi:aminopeptidase N
MQNLPNLTPADRVNLLSDTWALVQADRAPLAQFMQLIEKLPTKTELAEREQIVTAFDYIGSLLAGQPQLAQFQQYARATLRPSFDALGWEPKAGEPPRHATLRATLVRALGDLNDPEIVAGARERFEKFVAEPKTLAPDLRAPVLTVVGRYADEATWNRLHELGRKTNSIEEKLNFYSALNATTDPKLIDRALRIAMTDELPTSTAVHVVPAVARASGRPDLAWSFAQANMKALLEKSDAMGRLKYAPSLFMFFSDAARIDELKKYAAANLPETASKAVAKATDEMTFRADFRQRLLAQEASWGPPPPTRP